MHFCNLFSLFSNPKRKPRNCSSYFCSVSMAASSSHNVGSSVPLHLQEEENQQITLVVACSIPKKDLEVICELMVDFDSIEEHGFHIKEDIIFQGWTSLFAELYGPVYPNLVKEFWVHAVVAPKSILSFVHGKFVVVTENILRTMFDLRNPEGAHEIDQRADWDDVLSTLYTYVKETMRVKDMRDLHKIWTKILLGYFYHRKGTHAAYFVNNEQKYILYCIATQKKVDVIYIIFNHMWNAVRDSRNAFRVKKCTIIPFGRIITNLLVHSKIVENLEAEGTINDLFVTTGSCLNALTLRKMSVIDAIIKTPQPLPGARSRRDHILAEFEPFFRSEVPRVRTRYLKSLKEDEGVKDQEKGAPTKEGRKKTSTSRAAASEDVSEAAPEAAVKKERRTKRKFNHPFDNQVKVVQSVAAATTVEKAIPQEVAAEEVQVVSVATKKSVKETAEKKKKTKKKKKLNKNVETGNVVEKKKIRKRKLIIDASDEDED